MAFGLNSIKLRALQGANGLIEGTGHLLDITSPLPFE